MVWWLLLVNDHKNLDIRSGSPSAVFSRRVQSHLSQSNVSFLMLNKYWLWVRLWCLLFARGISAWAEANYTHPGTWGPSQASKLHETWNNMMMIIKNQLNHETRDTWERVTAGQAARLTLYDHWDTDWGPVLLATSRVLTRHPGPAAWEPATLKYGAWPDPEVLKV